MNAPTRALLVAPLPESRRELEPLLKGQGTVRLVEVCTSYAAAAEAATRTAAEVLIVDLDADIDAAVGLVGTLARARGESVVLPASRSREVDLVLRTIRAGAREFLTLPISAEELRAALDRVTPLVSGNPPGDPARASQVIAILGAAGGIGCTTLAVNLAATLAKDSGREVALVDLDLILGAVDACFDLIPDQTLADVARSVDRLDQTLLKRSLTRHASGVHVLASPVTLEEAAKIDPASIRLVLERLRDTFPVVILDLGKSLGEADITALQLATSIVLVVQLEPACLRNSARLLELFRQQFDGLVEKVGIVANRVGSNPFEVSAKKAEELLRAPVKWQVPNEYKTFTSARTHGVPVETEAPGSRAHRAILELARDFGSAEAERYRSRFGRIAASFF